MGSEGVLDDYCVDSYFFDTSLDLKMCYGNKNGRELVLWNTDKDANNFLEFVQQSPDIDEENVYAEFSHPSSLSETEYVSDAKSIMRDGLFDHVEHLSASESQNSFSLDYLDSKELRRDIYSPELSDSELNVIALSAENLPENFSEIVNQIRPFDTLDKDLEGIIEGVEKRS